MVNEVKVDLSEKERQAYDTMRAELVLSLNGEEVGRRERGGSGEQALPDGQCAVYGEGKRVLRLHDRKLDALEDLIEAANGKPVLVAYWFKHDLERIRERFIVREIKTSRDIADWNQGKIPVAVIHPASAGHGLNLQSGGSTLVWFGLTWSLELYQQTNARLWRQGQKDTTVVIHHISRRTPLTSESCPALQKKERAQSALIDAVKADLEVRK